MLSFMFHSATGEPIVIRSRLHQHQSDGWDDELRAQGRHAEIGRLRKRFHETPYVAGLMEAYHRQRTATVALIKTLLKAGVIARSDLGTAAWSQKARNAGYTLPTLGWHPERAA